MATNVTIPSLGESVSEAVLIRWLKNDGDAVKQDESLAELETDKANVELPSNAAGALKTLKKAGDTVKIGEVVAQIEGGGGGNTSSVAQPAAAAPKAESPKAAAPAPTPPAPAAPAPAAKSATAPEDLSPAVRRVVAETKIDPAAVTPTGPGGRITKDDAVRYAETSGSAAAAAPTAIAPAAHKAPAAVTAPRPLPAAPEGDAGYDADGVKRVPMSKIRKRIAQSLVQAQQTAAILTTFNEIDMSAVMGLRAKYKDRFQEVHGVGLGFMSFFARAVALAIKEFPRVNARIDGDDIVYHNHVHLGIAVSTERGLMVPVLRHVEQLSFAQVESEIKRLALAARDGKVAIHELTGGTFTVTNGGVFGSLLSTPIINPPQSGILGMHAIVKRPVAAGDKVEIRPMMYVALSYDHRIVDGRESVSFLVRLKEFLEDPARLILEI